MRIFKYISILLVILVAFIYIRESSSTYQTLNGKIFGTYYNIKIRTNTENKQLENKVKQELKLINTQMSMFDALSEVSRINQTPAKKAVKLSPELSYLLKNAAKVNQDSKGAFDPTVGKLVDLWGFGVDTITRTPTAEKIKETLTYTGFDKLKFATDYSTITKKDTRTSLDLSAIAKGYGVDQVAKLLEKEGYHDYIVEIGGEIRASGTKDEQGANWSIGIAQPSEKGNRNAFTMDITDYSVATSGDYRNFFYKDGHRYAHTISPQDGYPVQHNLASVTVFHAECMLADAYATAIMAMGEAKGMAMAEKLKLPVIMFIRKPDNNIVMEISTAAKDLIGD